MLFPDVPEKEFRCVLEKDDRLDGPVKKDDGMGEVEGESKLIGLDDGGEDGAVNAGVIPEIL